MGCLNIMKSETIKYQEIQKILDKIKNNRQRIKFLDPVLKDFKDEDYNLEKFKSLKEHCIFCHKELLETYKILERILNATKKKL